MAATDAERVKPTKPDEAAYKTSLAEAEKEHTAAQEKLVWMHLFWNCFTELSSDLGRGDDPRPTLLIVLVFIIYLHTISSGQ